MATGSDFVWRKVTGRSYYHPKYAAANAGGVELTLECGHKQRRKRSAEPGPNAKVKCTECYYDQSGGM